MRTSKNQTRLFLLTLPGFFIAGLVSMLKEPVFIEMKNLEVSQVGVKESVIKMEMIFYNPNRLNLKLKKAEIDIYLDDRFAGRSIVDTLIKIPREDTFSIPVQVKVEMKTILPNALSAFLYEELKVRLDGYVRLGKAGVYINVPIQQESLQKLNFSGSKKVSKEI